MKKILLLILYLILPFAVSFLNFLAEKKTIAFTKDFPDIWKVHGITVAFAVGTAVSFVIIIMINNLIIKNFNHGKLWGILGSLPLLIVYYAVMVLSMKEIIPGVTSFLMGHMEFIFISRYYPANQIMILILLVFNNIFYKKKEIESKQIKGRPPVKTQGKGQSSSQGQSRTQNQGRGQAGHTQTRPSSGAQGR